MTGNTTEQPSAPSREGRPLASDETIVRGNGVDPRAETFGDPADPALLLIVVHGVLDAVLPLGHALARTNEISAARLLPLVR